MNTFAFERAQEREMKYCLDAKKPTVLFEIRQDNSFSDSTSDHLTLVIRYAGAKRNFRFSHDSRYEFPVKKGHFAKTKPDA